MIIGHTPPRNLNDMINLGYEKKNPSGMNEEEKWVGISWVGLEGKPQNKNKKMSV
ncbi:hypothetical protein HanRHA438_Chr10g0435071 [Helianthus annuus]|nr:hypothetical protein HanRHA438_Chr10g0435071 [Helianthus annuus]